MQAAGGVRCGAGTRAEAGGAKKRGEPRPRRCHGSISFHSDTIDPGRRAPRVLQATKARTWSPPSGGLVVQRWMPPVRPGSRVLLDNTVQSSPCIGILLITIFAGLGSSSITQGPITWDTLAKGTVAMGTVAKAVGRMGSTGIGLHQCGLGRDGHHLRDTPASNSWLHRLSPCRQRGGEIKGQQITAIPQQPLNVLQAQQLFGIHLALVGELHLHRRQALLQPHQPLGEGMERGGQILRVAGNAE
mgnify:CR=1 FL=1